MLLWIIVDSSRPHVIQKFPFQNDGTMEPFKQLNRSGRQAPYLCMSVVKGATQKYKINFAQPYKCVD